MGSRARWNAVALAGVLLGGCAGSSDSDDPGDKPGVHGSDGLAAAAQAVAALRRAESCDDLLTRIQDDVATKISLQAELLRDPENASRAVGRGPISGPGGFTNVPPPVGTPTTGVTPGAAPSVPQTMSPSAGNAGSSDGDGAAPGVPNAPLPQSPSTPSDDVGKLGPQDFSETNTQVEGVDEADIVKTDGTHIYLLHGNKLFVLDSWPADETALRDSIAIEGTATEMFVKDGVAAVFSLVYDQGDLVEQPKVADSTGAAVRMGPYYYGSQFTKITLVDVKAQPAVTRQLLIEGNYLSARLHGSTVRAVVQGGFRAPQLYAASVEYTDPWGRAYEQEAIDLQVDAWRDRMISAVMATELSDWLPVEREIINGKLGEPSRRCTDFYAPSPGLASYGLTNVVSFDMLDPKDALGGAVVLGSADNVYANDHALVLAARDYRFDQGFIQKERTVLHMFALDGDETSYLASGALPGHIVDQFSIDERDGIVRISTSARLLQNFVPPVPALQDAVEEEDGEVESLGRTTDNRVLTLREKDGALVKVGATEPLGHDGETIFSTRFIGDVGYVVTFRQRDPLIAVDLSDPAALRVLGELEIPGFSDYMHPLGPDHLLTIGRSATDQGVDTGLQLQIFDVSDPTAPRRTHGYRFADGGYSEANVNHKAFTFHTPAGTPEGEGLLAFPYVSYSGVQGSSLELFEVSATNGFDKLGSISHTSMLQQLCTAQSGGMFGAPVAPINPNTDIAPGFPQGVYFNCVPPEVRRGLFIFGNEGDFVYSISHGGVLVHELADLKTPVASVALPYPDWSDHRMYYGDGSGGLRPATGGTAPVGMTVAPTPTTPAAATPDPQPAPEG